jgi:tRNA modification GTPase
LALVEGLRPALAGEFTRRAFENGRIDLAEAEGLADLLAAETHSQRRAALSLAGGRLSRCIEGWQDQVLGLSAGVEALLDFSDEGDVADVLPASWSSTLDSLISELESVRRSPPIERLRDGVRVVIAGPPNAGKSSLLNWLVGRQAAITSATPGTTRDAIEAPTAIGGAPFLLVDTAGLRDSSDEIEAVGVALAREHVSAADIILWLGAAAERPPSERAIIVGSKADLCGPLERPQADIHVSTKTGEGMSQLVTMLVERSRAILPGELEVSINTRHRDVLTDAVGHLITASREQDLLIRAEALRLARASLDRVTGRVGVEAMLDRLFGSFCIGK